MQLDVRRGEYKENCGLGGTTVYAQVNHCWWLLVERTKERNSLLLLQKKRSVTES